MVLGTCLLFGSLDPQGKIGLLSMVYVIWYKVDGI